MEAESLIATHDIFFFFAEAEDETAVRKLTPKSFELIAQSKSDLPIRVDRAFEHVFCLGYTRVVIFPTDVPELSASTMLAAGDALMDTDCVAGPDSDGGYYCFGMRSYNPEILKVTYGATNGMYEQTLQNVVKNNMTYTALPEVSDIDTIDDLQALQLRSPLLWASHYTDLF